MASPAGRRSGATFNWAKYSTSRDSANGPATSIARRCKPTTTPRARWTKPANICRLPTPRRAHRAVNRFLVGEFQPAQLGGLFLCHIVGHDKHLKSLAHGFGTDEVLELQCDLGAFLREFAILKRIGELGFFPNADEELRLREQSNWFESQFTAARSERGEVHVGRDVLLTRSFIRRRTRLMSAIGHQGIAVTSGKLLFAGVAVVDQDSESTSAVESACDAIHPRQRSERSLDSLSRLGLNAVTIEKH